MATLSTRTYQQIVDDCVAAVQTGCSALTDISEGSPLLAVIEANGLMALWLQVISIQVLASTRLFTSTGSDVDSFVGDWGLTRLPAVAASGPVTFSRASNASSQTILVGQTAVLGDLSLSYAIAADTTNAYWSATAGTAGGYIVPSGIYEITVPVVCTTPGTAGNVIAGAVSLPGTSPMDYVTNAGAFTNGLDAETDAQLKARFVAFIGGLRGATVAAIAADIMAVRQGLTYLIQENKDPEGNPVLGMLSITIDDGSGAPPTSLISAVYAAVNNARAASIRVSVQPPTVLMVASAFTLVIDGTSTLAVLTPLVQAAVSAYIDSVGIGGTVSLTKVAAVVYGVSPSIQNVLSTTLNGTASDIVLGQTTVSKAAAVTVS